MEISFGRFRGVGQQQAARRGTDLCGFEAAKLRQENAALRNQNQRLAAAVAKRNALLQQVAGRGRVARPAPARGATAQRATVAVPSAPRSAPARDTTVLTRPTAPQVLETDRDFTSPTDEALARAWFGGHLGGTGYDGLDATGVGIEDALGLDG